VYDDMMETITGQPSSKLGLSDRWADLADEKDEVNATLLHYQAPEEVGNPTVELKDSDPKYLFKIRPDELQRKQKYKLFLIRKEADKQKFLNFKNESRRDKKKTRNEYNEFETESLSETELSEIDAYTEEYQHMLDTERENDREEEEYENERQRYGDDWRNFDDEPHDDPEDFQITFHNESEEGDSQGSEGEQDDKRDVLAPSWS
jgi:hypothetical protein